jgi:hypothetical protein
MKPLFPLPFLLVSLRSQNKTCLVMNSVEIDLCYVSCYCIEIVNETPFSFTLFVGLIEKPK